MPDDAQIELDGHLLRLTNLSKVLYPATGTTKADVIGYYAEVAHAMLPHVIDRPVTRKRWPDGVAAKPFFQKNVDAGTPSWVPRHEIEHKDHPLSYPVIDSPATLAWMGQNAALEIHVPQWRFGPRGAIRKPDRLVFDLDPGPEVDLAQCAIVARAVRERLDDAGMPTFPVTSGSKGIHLYARLDGSMTSDQAADLAHQVAEALEREMPDLVLSRMARNLRPGKIFLDWSQNNAAKTTIAPYSLRGRDHPMVAAPRTWEELDDENLSQLEYREVLRRLAAGPDPMAGVEPAAPRWATKAGTATAKKGSTNESDPGDDAVDKLAKYRSKRSSDKTPEPVPEPGDLPQGNDDTFVIQEHHARALHWDFRLERGGVLVSWALPKGIPTDTRHNRLAVQTEDHPLEYASFAGDIPQGEYGGGDVTIWDSGHYATEKWREDEIIVEMSGQLARGRFALIRTRGNQWLMHRTKDQADLPAVTSRPARPRTAGSSQPAEKSSLPTDLAPMLATAGTLADVSSTQDWRFEGKWDGVRALALVDGTGVRLISRNDKDMSRTYPELAELSELLEGHQAVLDGEIVALDTKGRSDFSLLQQRMKLAKPAEIVRVSASVSVDYFLFDILFLDGVSLLGKKFDDRRRILQALAISGEHSRIPEALPGPAEDALAHSRSLGWEGILAKKADSTYLPGKRSWSWIKVKNQRDQEVVIVGWRPGAGRREGTIGSLLLGIPSADGFDYVGRVGTGFTDAVLDDLFGRLKPLERRITAVTGDVPRAETRDAHWVRPALVGEVRFAEWTRDGLLRQASWRGLRPDKNVVDVRRES